MRSGFRCVELRALCDEVPRTPPGPEGSNGTGIASCAAEYPKFLSSAARRFLYVVVPSGARNPSFGSIGVGFLVASLLGMTRTIESYPNELPGHRAEMAAADVCRRGRAAARHADACE